jgi:hypothetical protein
MTRHAAALMTILLFGAFPAMAGQRVSIPEDTRVDLEVRMRLDPASDVAGQTVPLVVAADVRVRGSTVIAAGTPVTGYLEAPRRSGAGSLVLDKVQAVDGSALPLSGELLRPADDPVVEVGTRIAGWIYSKPAVALPDTLSALP